MFLWYNVRPNVCHMLLADGKLKKSCGFGGIKVKRLAVVLIVILVVIFGLKTTFSMAETKSAKPAAKEVKEQPKPVKDANAIADANQAGEPNEADEVERAFQEASKTADMEYQEVMRQSTENRAKMMTAMQKQAVSELEFIRSLAVEEKATKTVKAVDLAIERIKERYDNMVQSMKERQEREAQRAEREAKKEHRTDRDQQRRRPR